MLNQEIFTQMIKDKGKEAVIKDLFTGLKDHTLTIRTDLARQNNEELSMFKGKLPLLLHIIQDINYLKQTGFVEKYHEEVKEERYQIGHLSQNKRIDYYLQSFAEWVVENPEYSYLFDPVEQSVVHDFDGGYPINIPKIPKKMYEK